jgi:hypothetical protein
MDRPLFVKEDYPFNLRFPPTELEIHTLYASLEIGKEIEVYWYDQKEWRRAKVISNYDSCYSVTVQYIMKIEYPHPQTEYLDLSNHRLAVFRRIRLPNFEPNLTKPSTASVVTAAASEDTKSSLTVTNLLEPLLSKSIVGLTATSVTASTPVETAITATPTLTLALDAKTIISTQEIESFEMIDTNHILDYSVNKGATAAVENTESDKKNVVIATSSSWFNFSFFRFWS